MTDTTEISRLPYADLLRDDSDAANNRRDIAIEANYPHCDLCGRVLKPGTTVKAAYAYGDGRLAAVDENLDIDHANVSEILIGNDCAREIPAAYTIDWTIEEPMRPMPKYVPVLSMPTSTDLAEIVDAANEQARFVDDRLVLDATGAVIIDAVQRVWVETEPRDGLTPDGFYTGGWWSNDGHLALSAADVFNEDAWTM